MPAPLSQELVVEEVRARLLEMTFTVPNDDGSTSVVHPSGAGMDQLSAALGKAIFNILKQQVQITGVSAVGGPVQGVIQ